MRRSRIGFPMSPSMKSNKIELSPQAATFLRILAPKPRQQLRAGLRALGQGKGDIIELEHPLDGFCRLRVGRYRVVFHTVEEKGSWVIRCDFIERRKLVYELFSDLIKGE